MSKNNKKIKNKNGLVKLNNNIKKGEGKFNFLNGDSYEGNYVVVNNKEIYRQDFGIYKTSEGDEYQGLWDKDCIASKIHILYGNKAEYEGEIDDEGAMQGKGTYTFPDGSSLKATWKNNEPDADYVYKDPLGYDWIGKLSVNEQKVVFSPEHHLWD